MLVGDWLVVQDHESSYRNQFQLNKVDTRQHFKKVKIKSKIKFDNPFKI